ncbi:MAG: amidohydrolase family protein [Gammaproteobacteria bacterium]|nr:amidohydrolase family protein [Gammaproteobacteria bacterium]
MTNTLCDMHVHLVGLEESLNGCFLRLERLPKGLKNVLAKTYGLRVSQFDEPGIDEIISNSIIGNINSSSVDHAVLLALDEIYDQNGKQLNDKTVCYVDNDYTADLASKNEKILFGASIHPYRQDALSELERLAKRGACLVKWLPSAQGIALTHPKCLEFYDALCTLNMPLLCHVGIEHVLPGGDGKMNNPLLLRPALERGVTVIAAHCGSRIFITEKCYFKSWVKLAHQYPNFYGDISAFGYPLRSWALRKILHDPVLVERIIYGSDFPSPILLYSFLGMIPFEKISKLKQLSNPFDKSLQALHAAGVPSAVFSRAYQLLHLNNDYFKDASSP